LLVQIRRDICFVEGVNHQRIRLTRKLALVLNGVDVSGLIVGDVMELPLSAAEMMVAEGWAQMIDGDEPVAQLALHNHPQTYLTN
jgi:hypothetical protein